MIYELAIPPRLTQVDLEGGNMFWENHHRNDSRRLLPRCLNRSPLLSANRGSRVAAQKYYGESYMFVAMWIKFMIPPVFRHRATARTSPPTAFRPRMDTLFFPDMMPFAHLAWIGAFGKEKDKKSIIDQDCKWSAYRGIRSVIIGGMVERGFWRDKNWSHGPQKVCLFATPRSCSGVIPTTGLVDHFPDLEKVVIVSPTIPQLVGRRKQIRALRQGMTGLLLDADELKTQQNAEEIVKLLTLCLKKAGDRMTRHSNEYICDDKSCPQWPQPVS